MLLTQSQVSVAVSSAVVFIFTLLLFLSGYTIQQRTVSGLKEAIKPKLPQAPHSSLGPNTANANKHSSRFFRQDGSAIAYLDFSRTRDQNAEVDWTRLAHVQVARSHHEVCNAVMVLADLHRLKSPPKRVLLFPQAWAAEKAPMKGEPKDPYMDSTRRLMRLAARRYGVELRPVSPWAKGKQEVEAEGPAPPTSPGEEDGEWFSLASAFALTDFDRVLFVEAPGLMLDATPLDGALAFAERAPFAMLHDSIEGDGVRAEDLLLLQPSGQTHHLLSRFAASTANFNDSMLSSAFTEPLLLDSSSDTTTLIRSIGTLHQHDPTAEFNKTAFLSDVAYLRFSDPKLPGPEYDVPWSDKVAARPKNREADWAWTKLYGQFAQKRMEVCGMDLETWRP